MHNRQYQSTIDWLFQQFPSYQKIGSSAYKPTLDNTYQLLKLFGNPHLSLKFIHVAGSNGKGSVCSYTASILKEAGFKTGLFTSPHIKDFTERACINGLVMDKDFVIQFVDELKDKKMDFDPSFFEITFVMALKYFEQNKCDICVIETGLGGRLDATNTIIPILSVITSISLEHTQILGSTIDLIASEKAGIIKEKIPVVINIQNDLAEQVIRKIASNKNSKIIELETIIPEEIKDRLIADYQNQNVLTTLTVVKGISDSYQVSFKNIIDGIKNVTTNSGYKGRLEIINKTPLTILDVSHNAAGIEETIKAVNAIYNGTLNIITGFANDKDLHAIKNVLPTNANYFFTEFANQRSCSIQELKDEFVTLPSNSKRYYSDPQEAMKAAISNSNNDDCILVFGSFFLIEHFF